MYFLDESLRLFHHLSDEYNIGCGSISDNVILSRGGACDHAGGGMLDLHFVEQDVSVLGELDLTGSTDKPV